jgi:hypothetical protein
MLDKILEEIESNLYQLMGQIEYGEISDIDTYWASLTESIQRLSEFGYDFSFDSESLADVLEPFDNIINDNLRDLAYEMETFCEGGGSTDSVDSDEIEKLQEKAIEFEKKFLNFTRKLRELHGN